MEKTEIIRTEADKNRVIGIIKGLPLTLVHRIDVRIYKRNRSLEQNALYWKWLTVMGAELGYSKDELHEQMKEKHLVPILTREDENYALMVSSVIKVRKSGMTQEADYLKREIIKLTSTTGLDVEHMSEYMTAIDREAITLGIRLPVPLPEEYEKG